MNMPSRFGHAYEVSAVYAPQDWEEDHNAWIMFRAVML